MSASALASQDRTAQAVPETAQCLSCNLGLDLIQPDIDRPDCILGHCAGCHRLYAVRLVPKSHLSPARWEARPPGSRLADG